MPVRPSPSLRRCLEEEAFSSDSSRTTTVLAGRFRAAGAACRGAGERVDRLRRGTTTSTSSYSNSELQQGARQPPRRDSDEYSNCREILAGAIQGGSDKGGGRPKDTGPNGEPLSAKEQARRAKDNAALAAIAGDTSGDPVSFSKHGEEWKIDAQAWGRTS